VAQTRETLLAIMAANGIPGAAVTLVYGDEPLWTEGFGLANPATGLRADPHTIFSLQSISKNFAATAILIAVQEGLLDLDKSIAAYVPGFTVNSRHEQTPEKKMTLRLLLSHRAGFTHEAPIGNNFDPQSPAMRPLHSLLSEPPCRCR